MDKVTTLATVVGSLVAVATFVNAVRQYRRKVHLEIFRMYADRYNQILTPDIYEKWVVAIKGNRGHWIELNPTMIRYLNLIWEEYYLSRDKLIPHRLWPPDTRYTLPNSLSDPREAETAVPESTWLESFRL